MKVYLAVLSLINAANGMHSPPADQYHPLTVNLMCGIDGANVVCSGSVPSWVKQNDPMLGNQARCALVRTPMFFRTVQPTPKRLFADPDLVFRAPRMSGDVEGEAKTESVVLTLQYVGSGDPQAADDRVDFIVPPAGDSAPKLGCNGYKIEISRRWTQPEIHDGEIVDLFAYVDWDK